EGKRRAGSDRFRAGGPAARNRRGRRNRKRKFDATLSGLRFYSGRFQKNRAARVQHMLHNVYRSIDRIVESDAQRHTTRRQSSNARTSRRRTKRSDAQSEREPAKSSGGGKLRNGRVIARPD